MRRLTQNEWKNGEWNNMQIDPFLLERQTQAKLKKFSLWEYMAEAWAVRETWETRPIEWIQDHGEVIWSTQKRIAESVRDNRYTVSPACHGAGKSFIASRIISWWIESHSPGEAFVISTAPSAAQVMAILWREISRFHARSGPIDKSGNRTQGIGKINRAGYPKWYIGNELVGYGRKPADYTENAFQGIHAKYVLVVLDEAAGITQHLFNAVDALATNDSARVLAIGNPTDGGSHFANICKPGSGWNVVHIDGLRTPFMTYDAIVGPDPQKPIFPWLKLLMEAEEIEYSTEILSEDMRENLISPLWIEERILRWGGCGVLKPEMYDEDTLRQLVRERCAASPLFLCKVRGIFPTTGSTGVIPLGWVQLAVDRWHAYDDKRSEARIRGTEPPEPPGRRVVGIDVARSDLGDESCIAIRQGNFVEPLKRFRNSDTTETADEAAFYLNHPQSMAVVDVIGIGAGVFDVLRRYAKTGQTTQTTIAFNASAKSPRTDKIGEFKFRNDRAAAWWNLRELLDPSKGSNIMLPDDEQLIEELTAVKFETFVGGIIKVEPKEDIRKRIGRSTDSADAVIMSFWVQGLATNNAEKGFEEYHTATRSDDLIPYEGYQAFSEFDMSASAGSSGYNGSNGMNPFNNGSGGWDL